MIGFGMIAGGTMASVEHVQVVALYDPETGQILHLHTVTTLAGGTPTTREAAITDAKQRALRRHPNAETLAVAISNDPEHGRTPHRIDPDTKAFVPHPPANL